MDSRKIVEVLRATLDANQQQAAHEQLTQVGEVNENLDYDFSRENNKHMGAGDIFALKNLHFHCSLAVACNCIARPFLVPPLTPSCLMTLKWKLHESRSLYFRVCCRYDAIFIIALVRLFFISIRGKKFFRENLLLLRTL
jgi:hypothetical protein